VKREMKINLTIHRNDSLSNPEIRMSVQDVETKRYVYKLGLYVTPLEKRESCELHTNIIKSVFTCEIDLKGSLKEFGPLKWDSEVATFEKGVIKIMSMIKCNVGPLVNPGDTEEQLCKLGRFMDSDVDAKESIYLMKIYDRLREFQISSGYIDKIGGKKPGDQVKLLTEAVEAGQDWIDERYGPGSGKLMLDDWNTRVLQEVKKEPVHKVKIGLLFEEKSSSVEEEKPEDLETITHNKS